MAKNTKWEVVAWSPFPAIANGAALVTIGAPAISSQATLSVLDSADIESHDVESLTLLRLVGSVRFGVRSVAGGIGSPAVVKLRLHTGMLISQDGLPVTAFADPWDASDAEEDFAWERTYDVHGVNPATTIVDWNSLADKSTSTQHGDHPYWAEIDIRTKRTCRPPEVLGLTVAVKGVDSDVCEMWAWLRALVAVPS